MDPPQTEFSLSLSCRRYWLKWKGVRDTEKTTSSSAIPFWQNVQGSFGTFLAVAVIGILAQYGDPLGFQLTMASLGATAFLVFSFPEAPFSQPRNVVFGNLISSFVAAIFKLYVLKQGCIDTSNYNCEWLAAALAAFFSSVLMLVTQTAHPPGIATTLSVFYSTSTRYDGNAEYFFILFPCLSGSLIILAIGLLYTNLFPGSSYPKRWW
jgi:CBS-domain-containing membrane protein